MGKGSKRRLHDKETDQQTDADSDNEEAENSSSDRPLPKLVLKVSKDKKSKNESTSNAEEQPNHHKKKKKKHKHKSEEHVEKKNKKIKEEVPGESEPPPPKKIHWRHREKEKRKIQKEPEIPPFRLCLENLHRNLQRKDVYNIFSFPVTDMIAPGYSKIIKKPMDFLTMQRKIYEGEYSGVAEFRNDFVLMCNNAMQYNGSDTIYYKHAEKMLSLGLKMLTKLKLKRFNKALGCEGSDYSDDEDIQVDDNCDVNIEMESADDYKPTAIKKRSYDTKKSKKEQTEEMTASILAAARTAREKLLKKHPNQKYGYLSTDNEGNTSFNVLNPDTAQGERSIPTNVGKIACKLTTGVPASQITYKEDKKNKVVPVNYLMYGPYGSFGPSFDSSLSNITKEESDLLVQTYGSELGIKYSKSILDFTKDSPYLQNYIDQILDAITGNNHSKYKETTKSNQEKAEGKVDINGKDKSNVLEKKLEEECEKKEEGDEKEKKNKSNVDVNDLMSLDGLGIDVSFLKEIGPNKSDEKSATNECNESNGAKRNLDKTADLLSELQLTQYDRLSSGKVFARNIPTKEKEIAYSVSTNLKELMSFVSPKDVVSAPGLQKAIGYGKVQESNKETGVSNIDSSTENKVAVSRSSENAIS